MKWRQENGPTQFSSCNKCLNQSTMSSDSKLFFWLGNIIILLPLVKPLLSCIDLCAYQVLQGGVLSDKNSAYSLITSYGAIALMQCCCIKFFEEPAEWNISLFSHISLVCTIRLRLFIGYSVQYVKDVFIAICKTANMHKYGFAWKREGYVWLKAMHNFSLNIKEAKGSK